MKRNCSRVIMGVFFIMILALGAGCVLSSTSEAKSRSIKINKRKIVFSSPNAKSVTIKVTPKNLSNKDLKKIMVYDPTLGYHLDSAKLFSYKIKGKKLTITPKRAGDVDCYVRLTGPKYGDVHPCRLKITIKGHSNISVKSYKDMKNIDMDMSGYWTYVLKNDLDMTGKPALTFCGVDFDGNGHTIKSDHPIIASADKESTVKNTVFQVNYQCKTSDNDSVKVGGKWITYKDYDEGEDGYVSSVAPVCWNAGKVINCRSYGTVTSEHDAPSGVEDDGDDDVSFETGGDFGGVVGYNTGTVSNCSSSVEMTIKNLYKKSSTNHAVGGVVGSSDSGTIKECLFDGKLTASIGEARRHAGGIVGKSYDSSIIDCLNKGDVLTSSGTCGGGILGTNGEGKNTVKNVLSTGKSYNGLYRMITSESADSTPKFENAFWLESASEAKKGSNFKTEANGTFKIDEAALKMQETFTGFDFENVWTMTDSGPTLKNIPA